MPARPPLNKPDRKRPWRKRTFLSSFEPTSAEPTASQYSFALGVLDAAADLGLRVPEDLSIVGFDDIPAEEAEGPTTIGQPPTEKGMAAFTLVRSGGTEHVLLPHTLVVRNSTGPVRD